MTTVLPNLETERLAALHRYEILDSPPEEAFDGLTSLAAQICQTPIALINLIDSNRQWFKSIIGLEMSEAGHDVGFCPLCIQQGEVFIIPDTWADEHLKANAVVSSYPFIRFYAGVPLIVSEGYAIGTLCVLDYVPRQLAPEQIEALYTLSRQIVSQLELRYQLAALKPSPTKGKLIKSEFVDVAPIQGSVTDRETPQVVPTVAITLQRRENLSSMVRTEQIQAEIEHKLGFFPPFFSPAQTNPQVLENLWQQTLIAYVDNPLSALFKEKLSAYLSRYCAVPYCMICHSCSLRPLGMSALDVLALLESPPPTELEIDNHLRRLEAQLGEVATFPEPSSDLEESLLYCSIYLFLAGESAEYCRKTLRRLLGSVNYQHLVSFVAYVRTCHAWMEAHPEVGYEADQRVLEHFAPLVEDAPGLADFFGNYVDKVKQERQTWAEKLAELTERKRNQEAIRQSEEKFRNLVERTIDWVWEIDPNGAFTYVSPQVREILGYEPQEMLGKTTFNWMSVEEVKRFSEVLGGYLSQKQPFTRLEKTLIHKNGNLVVLETSGSPVFNDRGVLQGYHGIARDITERKRAEEERDRFFSLSLDMLCIANLDGYFIRLNPSWEKTLGYTNEELTSQPFLNFVHPEDREITLAELEKLSTGNNTLNFENRYRWQDGSYKWLAWTSVAIIETGLAYAIARDITPAKLAEQQRLQLLEREQAARSEAEAARTQIINIFESITTAFFALDHEWRFTYVNQQAEPLLKSKREELLGKKIWDEFPAAVGSLFSEQYHKAVSEKVSVEFEACYPPLNCWFEVHAYPSQDGLSVYFQDITERKQAQEELERQIKRSQLFSEITLKIRQSLQVEEVLQTTVTEVQRILQADRVLIYRIWPDGGNGVAEAVLPRWSSVMEQNFPGEVFPEEYKKLYEQGRVRAINDIHQCGLSACLVDFVEQFQVKAKLVVPIILNGKLWGLLIAHQCDKPRQWSTFEQELLQQLADQISLALAQAQLLEQETRQRQELMRSNEELQQFAYIASHDLQEPLRKIQAFGDRLKTKYSEVLTEQGRDYLDRMQNAAHRMQVLINDLLSLSRVTTKIQSFIPINLTQATQEVLSDLEIRIQQTQAQIEVGELPTLNADPLQMRQLLQNLLSNALKFHRDDAPPLIKIYSRRLLGQEHKPSGILPMAEVYQLFIEDNGIGFDEKYLDRIFNVFQRLHSRNEYEGAGMGLAICRKIVENHGGSITAKSTPGQGTTFIVTLPIKSHKSENQ